MNTSSRLLLILLFGTSLPAAELVVRDARLGLELLPTDFDYDLESSTSDGSSSDSFESHFGLDAGVLYSFSSAGDSHGFLVGGGVTAAQAAYGSIGHLTTFAVRAQGGYGWAVSDRWTVAGLAEVGYGLSTFDITANSAFNALSMDGTHLAYGARARLQYSFNDLLHIGLDVGWLNIDHELSGDSVDLTLTNSGLAVGLGISYRLSNTPRPLE